MGSTVMPPVVKVKALYCPSCGGPVELKGFAHSLSVVCPQCLSVLDATSPTFDVLQKLQESMRRTPTIPLGSRGRFDGAPFEAVGYQIRQVVDDGQVFEWAEYVLFNPYKGFRYLVEDFKGHWNFVRPVRYLPVAIPAMKPMVLAHSQKFKHFIHSQAATSFVLGEFPWRVKLGETVDCNDYIAPPLMLSSETTENEVVWSEAEYITGAQVWESFKLPGSPPAESGVFANQPNPLTGRPKAAWRMFGMMVALLFVLMIFFAVTSKSERVFQQDYSFTSGSTSEPSFVTPVFELKGRPAAVEIKIKTDLNQDWAYFGVTLINETTGQGYDMGKEVSYYSGSDSDGSWTEGERNATLTVGSVPAGRYYLRVEPEMESTTAGTIGAPHSMRYSIEVIHDVPPLGYFFLVLILLLVPPIWISLRKGMFESKRWSESDYASSGGSD